MNDQPTDNARDEGRRDPQVWGRVVLSTILTLLVGDAVILAKSSEPASHWTPSFEVAEKFERWLKRRLDPL
jgi:hypothetical protein